MIATLELYIDSHLLERRSVVLPNRARSVSWEDFTRIREMEVNRHAADLFSKYARAATNGRQMYLTVTFPSTMRLSTPVDIKLIQ